MDIVSKTRKHFEFNRITLNLLWERCQMSSFSNFHPMLTQPWNFCHYSFGMAGSTYDVCCMPSNYEKMKCVRISSNQSYEIELVNSEKWPFLLLIVLTQAWHDGSSRILSQMVARKFAYTLVKFYFLTPPG